MESGHSLTPFWPEPLLHKIIIKSEVELSHAFTKGQDRRVG